MKRRPFGSIIQRPPRPGYYVTFVWGGRRIKRCIYIDQNSIRFLDDAETSRFKDFALLRDYIGEKQQELAEYNAQLGEPANVNHRRLTNVGTYRAYVLNYLRHHPRVHREGMTLLVRQRPPGPDGLPIEIYCFTNITAWEAYEDIQADIFDHLLAIAPEFGLRVYQKPAGADLASLRPNTGETHERATADRQYR